MNKTLLYIACLTFYFNCYATGMAVALKNIVLYNKNPNPIVLRAPNISQQAKIKINQNSACLINQPIFFQPNLVNKDTNFYIIFSVESSNIYNAIMIDKDNSLSLASQSRNSKAYSSIGFDKIHLAANCGKKHTASPIKTVVENSPNNPPILTPKYCSKDKNKYQFVLSFGNSAYKVPKFTSLPICIVN
ncbi:MAG: hypothetical protein ACK5Z5_02020 [Neisseriaceae bacterium]